MKVTTSSIEVGSVETAQEVNVSVSYCIEIVRTVENSVAPTPTRIGNLYISGANEELMIR